MSDAEELYERLNPEKELKASSETLSGDADPCYFCDSREDIETHHIVPQRFNGSDSRSNNVDLCHDCHWKLERLYNVEFWNAIGVDDPRSSRETHLVCEQHQCNNQAVAKYQTSGTNGRVATVWRCGECADNLTGQPRRNSWSLVKDLREVSVDE